ncbi:MAG: hypothetical protein AVO35_06355 [Candidatus Aegiribacteria sp. MLS_C]|nr:MAG: hypothetical protein AVO35_06355 [Candidatus Aegiribacteria sp. MLS_C]
MGSAGRSLCRGPESIYGNPALLVPGFTASGGRWNLGTSAVSAAGGFSAGGSLTAGASLVYLGRGGLLRRDDSGMVTGEYSYSTGAALLGVSSQVLPWLRVGGSAGVSWENIDSDAGTGVAASAGVAAEVGTSGMAGLTVTGLGKPPEWNGVTKAMPVEVSAGGSWELSRYLVLFGGTTIGFSTASSLAGGFSLSLSELDLTAGYDLTVGEDETTGFFAGLAYTYSSGGTYIIEMAVSQRHNTDWPVLGGVSIRL